MWNAPDAVVVGVGNVHDGDDAAGPLVARRVAERVPGIAVHELQADPAALVELLAGATRAVLVDAVRSGCAVGAVRRFDVSRRPLPTGVTGSASTHAFGLAEAIELARALGRLPPRTLVFGVEGAAFATGDAPSPAVVAAVDGVAQRVLEELRTCAGSERAVVTGVP